MFEWEQKTDLKTLYGFTQNLNKWAGFVFLMAGFV